MGGIRHETSNNGRNLIAERYFKIPVWKPYLIGILIYAHEERRRLQIFRTISTRAINYFSSFFPSL